MERASSHAQSGTASKARARAMSDHMMIGSLGARSTRTPASRPKSANGSASSAVRMPISKGVASSSRAPVSGRARKVISPPKWVMVSELHSRTKSPWRHSPFNARAGFSRRNRFAIVFPLSLARYQKSQIVKLPNSGAIGNFSRFLAQFGFSPARARPRRTPFHHRRFPARLPDASGDPAGRGVRAERDRVARGASGGSAPRPAGVGAGRRRGRRRARQLRHFARVPRETEARGVAGVLLPGDLLRRRGRRPATFHRSARADYRAPHPRRLRRCARAARGRALLPRTKGEHRGRRGDAWRPGNNRDARLWQQSRQSGSSYRRVPGAARDREPRGARHGKRGGLLAARSAPRFRDQHELRTGRQRGVLPRHGKMDPPFFRGHREHSPAARGPRPRLGLAYRPGFGIDRDAQQAVAWRGERARDAQAHARSVPARFRRSGGDARRPRRQARVHGLVDGREQRGAHEAAESTPQPAACLTFMGTSAPAYWIRAKRALARRDPVLARIIRDHPRIALEPRGEPFFTLARSIVGQQISVKAAASVWARVVALAPRMLPEQVVDAGGAKLLACGLSRRKAEYLGGLARDFVDGNLHVAAWPEMDGHV